VNDQISPYVPQFTFCPVREDLLNQQSKLWYISYVFAFGTVLSKLPRGRVGLLRK
jgi:hypothetical protein